ncbi:hypothetical protein HX109_12945 [Galbibacter sp. BG1]|uniref:hypothetical protein n=1 Tax=Galbibacter sp. BG1 TaxID=1170699 RepID=UPI0015BF937C|nr:hypothetical protein [Galbibacter sp. BG1]QLE02418.1 hypothetical protein HX109_12945 [Galbibacter sp. BG1]
MIQTIRYLFVAIIILILAISCDEDDDNTSGGIAVVNFTFDSLREVENATEPMLVNLGLDNPYHGGGSVAVSIEGGEYGTDYTSNKGSGTFNLEIPANALVGSFTISPVDNENIDGNKELVISIGDAKGNLKVGDKTTLNFEIIDNDNPNIALVEFAEEMVSIDENNVEGTEIVINFDQASTEGGSITIETSGDAVFNTDYEIEGQSSSNFSIPISAGATSASFLVKPLDNDEFDADKKVNFTISEVSGGLELRTAINTEVTIVNDDLPSVPVIDFSSENVLSFTEADGNATINFDFSETTSEESTVAISISGSATLGEDFTIEGSTSNPFMLAVPVGSNAIAVNLELLEDMIDEDDEIITLTITEVTGGLEKGLNLQEQTFTLENVSSQTGLDYLETFEGFTGDAFLEDIGYKSFGLPGQTVGDNQILDANNNSGQYSDEQVPTGTSDNGLNFFYNAGQDGNYEGDGIVDNILITSELQGAGDITVNIDAAYAFKNQNSATVTFYYSENYDGSGAFTESEWEIMGTETTTTMNSDGFGNNAYKREDFSINTSGNFYIAIRITQNITTENYRLRWRFDNIKAVSN